MSPPNSPRIALLHYSAPPVVGGVEAVLAEHARLFAEAGYPTRVVIGRGGQAGWPLPAVQVIVIPELDSEHPANLAVAAALERGDVPPAFDGLSRAIEAALGDALAGCDVVLAHNVLSLHFNLPLTAALCRLAERQARPRFVAWCHDLSRHVNPARGPVRRGFPWDLLSTCHPSLTYVAVSPQRQRLLAGVLGCPLECIRVIPNGVDPALLWGLSAAGQDLVQAAGLLQAGLSLIMPVRITRAKNIEFALEVVAALKAAGVRPRLVVTGPPDPHSPDIQAYYAELRGLRGSLGLEAEVTFVYDGTPSQPGPLTIGPALVAELHRACDVLFMPSRREGFGLPVLEAGLLGKPVFATDLPVAELVGANLIHTLGLDESPRQAADRLLAWAEHDPGQRLRREVRQAYTWPAVFARTIEPLVAALAGEREAGPP